jgi:transposase-like protein
MTRDDESNPFQTVLQLLTDEGFDGFAAALEILLNEAMKLERAAVLHAEPYQRTPLRRGHANGFKPKTVLSRLGKLQLAIPQTRGIEFYPSVLERGERSERALKLALAEMYVQGVSTRKVAAITQELCGTEVTSMQVSRAATLLDEELSAWRNRPLGRTPFVQLDARYEKVRHGGSVVDCALLIATAVTPDGKRTILGLSVSLSEAEVHWREFLQSLIARGLHGVEFITSDDHAGLKQARTACFPGIPWQRCQFHLQQNAASYVPRQELKAPVAADLRAVFQASDRREADRLLGAMVEKYRPTAPRLVAWLETAVPEGLTVLALPAAQRKRLRTTNVLERLNEEIRRRTRVALLFPNEASLLRLASAVLIEICEDWETGKIYLPQESD